MNKHLTDAATQSRQLLETWDAQQASYIAGREDRFTAMLDVLEIALGDTFFVVDLACGPGSLSARILRRFPKARVLAVDIDPVLLSLARNALSAEYGDRLTILQTDLTKPDWVKVLGGKSPDAAVSTTALHWLLPEQQVTLYREIAGILGEGGVFLNGDHQRIDTRTPNFRLWAQRHDAKTQELARAAGAMAWQEWWDVVKAIDGFGELAAERERLFADKPKPLPTNVDFHLANMIQAGFSEVGTVWQVFDDYVVAARK